VEVAAFLFQVKVAPQIFKARNNSNAIQKAKWSVAKHAKAFRTSLPGDLKGYVQADLLCALAVCMEA